MTEKTSFLPVDSAADAAAAADDAAAAQLLHTIDRTFADPVIEQWFIESFYGSPVSQDTTVFNHVRKSVDELKRRLFPG
jgi:hypothetical protein